MLFFKCLLFLAAGAVIHELQHVKEKISADFDHQDIRNMGGLRQRMPITFVTMLIASLALAGIPLTSGYLSKDAILIQTFEWSGLQPGWVKAIPYLALLTSWMTTFYIARLIFKVFFGDFRAKGQLAGDIDVHETPAGMRYILVVLSIFCLFPLFSFNPLSPDVSWLTEGFTSKVFDQADNVYHVIMPIVVTSISVLLILLAYNLYGSRKSAPDFSGTALYKFSEKQWHFDTLYKNAIVNVLMGISKIVYRFDKVIVDGIVNLLGKVGLWLSQIIQWFDKYIVDGLVNSAASLAKTIGNFARHFQTGRLQHYLLTMVLMVLTFILIKYFSQTI